MLGRFHCRMGRPVADYLLLYYSTIYLSWLLRVIASSDYSFILTNRESESLFIILQIASPICHLLACWYFLSLLQTIHEVQPPSSSRSHPATKCSKVTFEIQAGKLILFDPSSAVGCTFPALHQKIQPFHVLLLHS